MQFHIDKENFGKDILKLIKENKTAFGIGAAVVLIAIVLLISALTGKNPKEQDPSNVFDLTGQNAGTEENVTLPELVEDGIPEISALFQDYFTALKNKDADALQRLVSTNREVIVETLQKEGDYVVDYQNIKCYSIPGLIDGTYAVYVYYEVKLLYIDTYVPSLMRMYVCTNDDGTYYINLGMVDGEVAAYLDDLSKREDVRELIAQVDNKLQELMQQDESIRKVYEEWMNGSDAANPTEPAPAETESPTEPPATEPPATEPPATEVQGSSEQRETVYALQNVNIRRTPDTNGELAGKLMGAASIERISDDGAWSKVLYNGSECYIKSEYLTTVKPDTLPFQAVDEKVYATTQVNVRKTPSTDGEIVGKLQAGDSVTRIGYNEQWSLVEYKGKECYISTDYLSKTAP